MPYYCSYFPVNFVKCFTTSSSNTSGWLLLKNSFLHLNFGQLRRLMYGILDVAPCRCFTNRSRQRRCSTKTVFLKTSHKFIRKHQCWSLFFNKVAGLRSAILLKKRLWRRCFPVKFAKCLRTPFIQNTSGRVLLKLQTLNIPSHTHRFIMSRNHHRIKI